MPKLLYSKTARRGIQEQEVAKGSRFRARRAQALRETLADGAQSRPASCQTWWSFAKDRLLGRIAAALQDQRCGYLGLECWRAVLVYLPLAPFSTAKGQLFLTWWPAFSCHNRPTSSPLELQASTPQKTT